VSPLDANIRRAARWLADRDFRVTTFSPGDRAAALASVQAEMEARLKSAHASSGDRVPSVGLRCYTDMDQGGTMVARAYAYEDRVEVWSGPDDETIVRPRLLDD
jgi:hypothetical protein